jgi:iron complex transport system substrate-binding protein
MVGAFRKFVSGVSAAVLLAGTAASAVAAPGKPQRIMSMNQCTDLLLLQIVPRSRIASISYVSREDVDELMPGADQGIPINRGTAEDIVKLKPDLILAGDFSTPTTRRFAREAGAPIVEVKSVYSFADIRDVIRQIGAAVGEPERAEALVHQVDAGIAELAAKRSGRPPRQVVAWSGGTTVPGKATLANAIFEAAGAVNIAALPGGGYSSMDVEGLLKADPDLIFYVGTGDRQPSAQALQGRHPLIRRLYDHRRIPYSEAAFSCGLPQSIEAARNLRRQMDAIPPRKAGK